MIDNIPPVDYSNAGIAALIVTAAVLAIRRELKQQTKSIVKAVKAMMRLAQSDHNKLGIRLGKIEVELGELRGKERTDSTSRRSEAEHETPVERRITPAE